MTWAALTAVIGTIGGLILGYFGWWQSKKVDARSAQLGVTSETRAGTDQIITGLNALIDQLQESEHAKRDDVRYLTARLDACIAESDALKTELARLRKKYGNGD